METASLRTVTGPVSADERRQIIDLYRSGTKVAEICRLTSRCRSSIYMVVNEAGAEHRNAVPGGALRQACEVCGEPVRYVPPSRREKEPGTGRFCSAMCMGKAKRLPPRDVDGELLCHRCGEYKPPDEFYPHASVARGYQYWCKDCCALGRRERAGIPQDPKLTRKYALKTAYGITPEEYDAMYEGQQGRCAICGDLKDSWQPGMGVEGRSRFLVVDHDHKTRRVRGLLCTRCNVGIGQFREDPVIMRAAILYVDAPEALGDDCDLLAPVA
jgi:hypothetical protein